ncbi:hypothetical protein BJ508DRAFT_2459 [Ascobolus immersus RN42]|uniref:Uncharacterized protein n=1 Tax=Ascobolus immersus RN42 TaxID=1160509 RepID=A0A3N4IV34_ASCIM|nr:hypothetical protein BJ508DRAFT_2459 [Ascobolus immersus RN42]
MVSRQVVLKTKTQLEDTEIWVRFAGYTKVEGRLMRFLEVDKMLRKAKSIEPKSRETHMFALQFPPTNLPPTCDKPYVRYELVGELRVNTGGNQQTIRSKPHELVFIPLLDPVLLEDPGLVPGSPIAKKTVISQEEIPDSSAPTPGPERMKLPGRVSSLRMHRANDSASLHSPKRTETFQGLTRRQLTLHEAESTDPLLDLKMNVEDSEYRPGNILKASYRLACKQPQTLPKILTLSIVSKQYLANGNSLEPINDNEIVTKVLATLDLTPAPTQSVTIPLPDENAFLKHRSPFLPTASLPFGVCTTVDAPTRPPGSSSSTSSTAALKGKTVVRNPTTTEDLHFIIRHSVCLTAHFKGEPDHTIEVPIAIGNQKGRKLKAPEFSITFHGGEGSSTPSIAASSTRLGRAEKGGKDVFQENEKGWDGRGQFPTLDYGARPYYREDEFVDGTMW